MSPAKVPRREAGALSLCHTANEGPVNIQYKCLAPIYIFPKIKLLFPKQNYNVRSTSSYTHISVREIYIFPGSVCLFWCREYVDQSWKYINRSQTHECGNYDWGRAIPRKGIHKWGFPCSASITSDEKNTSNWAFFIKPLFHVFHPGPGAADQEQDPADHYRAHRQLHQPWGQPIPHRHLILSLELKPTQIQRKAALHDCLPQCPGCWAIGTH